MNMIRVWIRKALNKAGYDILRLPANPAARQRLRLMRDRGINVVFDVGANTGQYAESSRALGYRGKIVSFEPLPDAYRELAAKAARDPLWEAVQTAVGDQCGEITLNVAKNSYSSSALEMLPAHRQSAPDTEYTAQIGVSVLTIDSVFDRYRKDGQKAMLKSDTQGFEYKVIAGCERSLSQLDCIQMELSLAPLYRDETLATELISLLRSHGFRLLTLESGHYNYTTGEILQVEGFFARIME